MTIFSKIFSRQKNKNKIVETKSKYLIEVPNCIGNRYVISDIHGCLITLKSLIEKLQLSKDDQVFFLGDYIDKGNNSEGVLDYIIELQNNFQVFPIKGNHEDDLLLLLEFKNTNFADSYLSKEHKRALFKPDYQLNEKYFNFIKDLPYFIELDEYILVHAGFDFKNPNPFENLEEMLWIRNMDYDNVQAKNKTIIHGHTPYQLEDIKEMINKSSKIIPLDNGCFYKTDDDFGNLLCLNLKTKELIIQKNID